MRFNLLFCGMLALSGAATIFAQTPTDADSAALKDTFILVIRHAEKPAAGYNLSTNGVARAQAYINYFKNLTIDGQPLKLDYIFAAADSNGSHRPRLTIEPASKTLGLAIDSRFKAKDVQGVADEIQSKPHGRAILIVWHHEKIPALLGALGANASQVIPNVQWPEDEYGWLIEMRYDSNGHLIETRRINEKLMPDDIRS